MKHQRGVALILALLVLSFLTILGTALLATSTIDVWISDSYKTAAQTLYLTEAGIEQARETLRSSALTASEMLTAAAGSDGILSTSVDSAGLAAADDRPLIPADPSARLAGQPLVDNSGRVIGHYHVWLRNDNAEVMNSTSDTNQILTLLSIGRIGSAQKTIEVTVVKAEFPRLPAALTLAGPIDVFDRTGSTLVADASEASPPDDAGLNPRLKTVRGLEKIIESIAANATDIYEVADGASNAIGDYADAANYGIAVVNGNLNLGPGTGYGILVVRGDLRIVGNFSWKGLILIAGQGVLHWNDVNGFIDGGLFIARTRAADRGSTNPLGSLLNARGGITADFRRARGSIQFNPSTIQAAGRSLPFTPIAIRER